jgi:para-aminobenzoate synthetase/4-amino-4-deoxychorismate lyase
MLLTPPLSAGILGGVLRRELIEEGKGRETILMPGDLKDGELFFGNSLRGLIEGVATEALAPV